MPDNVGLLKEWLSQDANFNTLTGAEVVAAVRKILDIGAIVLLAPSPVSLRVGTVVVVEGHEYVVVGHERKVGADKQCPVFGATGVIRLCDPVLHLERQRYAASVREVVHGTPQVLRRSEQLAKDQGRLDPDGEKGVG